MGDGQWLVHNVDCKSIGEQIAGSYPPSGKYKGHDAFQKHVVEQGDLAGLGINTREDLAKFVDEVIASPNSLTKNLSNDRSAYWDESTKTVVILDPKQPHGGTVFRPKQGIEYFNNLK